MTNCHNSAKIKVINKVINNSRRPDKLSVDNFMAKYLCITKNCCILVGGLGLKKSPNGYDNVSGSHIWVFLGKNRGV